MPPSIQSVPRSERAFSLVELMAVLGIVTILAAIAARIGAMDKSAESINSSLISLTGYLELARQTALSESTYTYVAFSGTSDASGAVTYIAMFESATGLDIATSTGSPLDDTAKDSAIRKLSKIVKISGVNVPVDGNSTLLGGMPSLSPGSLPPASLSTPDGQRTFDRMIKFTPQGFAQITDSPEERFGLVLIPQKGSVSSEKEKKLAAAVIISGLTGRVAVQRAGEP